MDKLKNNNIKTLLMVATFVFLSIDIVSYKPNIYGIFTSLILMMFFVWFSIDTKQIVYDKYQCIVSILFGITFVIGKEYLLHDIFLLNFSFINILIWCTQSCLMSISMYCFLTKVKNIHIKEKETFLTKLLDTNIYKIMLFLFICWIPYIIFMYPCFIQVDSAYELAQFLHLPNFCTDNVNLINPSQFITTHYSVLYTYLIGFFSKLININVGLYIYSILQTVFVIYAISKLFIYLNGKLNKTILSYCYMFVCFFPFCPFMLTLLEKDVLFFAIFILFSMDLYKLLHNEHYSMIHFMITTCLLCILRNNFVYAIIPFTIILIFQKRKMIILLISISCTMIGYQTFCQIQDITQGSKAEMYAVPILQVSKCVLEYPEELTTEDIEIIDKIVEYDDIELLFDAKNVDPLKRSFSDKKPTDNDVKNFLKLWIKLGGKHPITYIESFLNKTMGYFYPFDVSVIVQRRGYQTKNMILTEDYVEKWRIPLSEFGFHSNQTLNNLTENFDTILQILFNLPIMGLLTVSPTYIWIMIFTLFVLIKKRDYPNLLYLLFLILYFGTILFSPVDGMYEFRYIYPIFTSIPIFLLMIQT